MLKVLGWLFIVLGILSVLTILFSGLSLVLFPVGALLLGVDALRAANRRAREFEQELRYHAARTCLSDNDGESAVHRDLRERGVKDFMLPH
jgi:hypothetical protein